MPSIPMRILVGVVNVLPGRHLPHTPLKDAYEKPWPTTRRGLNLWSIALIFVIKGVFYLISPSPSMNDSMSAILDFFPTATLGAVTMFIGLYAMWMSYCHHGRDRYGYMSLSALSGAFAGSYLASLIVMDAPGYAWNGVLTWVITAWLIWRLAGSPDPVMDFQALRCDGPK